MIPSACETVKVSELKCYRGMHEDHANNNAALNILAAGHAVSACGDLSSVAS